MKFLKLYINFFQLVKTKFLLLIQVVFAFLMPIKALVLLVGTMILLDTISGLYKAYKTKEPITSHKLSKAISKMVLYQVALITFFCLDKLLIGEFVAMFISIKFFLTKVIAVFLCTVELVSLNENIKVITGNNFFEMFKKFLARAKELKKDITEITGEKKDSKNEG